MTKEFQPITTQETIKRLKLKREKMGEQLKNYSLNSDPKKYARLIRKAEKLDKTIISLINSIQPLDATGTIGQFTLQSVQNPEKRRTTRKKK